MPPSSPAAPATSVVQILASAFTELLTLTRDMNQRLLRIEADVHQLKEVLLHIPPSSPQSDDAQKGGDTDDDADVDDNADDEPNERDTEPVNNTIVQPESPKPMHESDSAGHNSPAAIEKLVEDSEHDEPDDECQILDMNFINPLIPVQEESSDDLDNESQSPDMKSVDPVADPIIPVQGEDSDVASEDSHPLSRKRLFSMEGSNNDLNVLGASPIFNDILQGKAPNMSYVVNEHQYNYGYYLGDGIYPEQFQQHDVNDDNEDEHADDENGIGGDAVDNDDE
ncbi:uncharacterized protein LOC128127558 [Lactuca sativa]|uniref:uncharacterized protein LOC128127558 n=1 Tax=Lactuca sativa TaxID=4236 RepID=UPI0022AFADCD|nr:uncharacterized protein LOC128127558 [Lactuca sativa]